MLRWHPRLHASTGWTVPEPVNVAFAQRHGCKLIGLCSNVRSQACGPLFASSEDMPWQAVDYYTKKKERVTDAYGNLIHNETTIREPAAWTQEARMTMALQLVACEVGQPEEQLREDLLRLQALLPDMQPGPTAKHADVVRVAARLGTAASNLLLLRAELPEVNVSRIAAQQLQLLLEEPERLREDVRQVKALLAGCGPAGLRELLEQYPQLLTPAIAMALLDEVARLFGLEGGGGSTGGGSTGGGSTGGGGGEGQGEGGGGGGKGGGRARAAALLGSNPGLVGEADCLRSQTRGERDPKYLADTTRAAG